MTTPEHLSPEHLDVIVVGAGLSGISAGWHLRRHCPDRRFAILEGRGAIGGTWDLFRYPGIRSDSDMHTLGFAFRPWTGERSIAGGAAIRDYLVDTARETGVAEHVRLEHRVTAAAWSTADARWTLTVETPRGPAAMTCGFLFLCSGYYDYARGHAPDFPDQDRFAGPIVHPQHWPADLDVAGKQVVVIGSGATAVTLVPALADPAGGAAARVTMLQRSPTYVVSRPSRDAGAERLRRLLPARLAAGAIRWRNVGMGAVFYRLARQRPTQVARRLIGMVQAELGPAFDVGTHFTPRYAPWDQRLCLTPDGDLFAALRAGRAAVVTDRIARFVPDGIVLESGDTLAADVIVTATGLELKLMGGVPLDVDGRRLDLGQALQYRGMMFDGVPNLAFTFGYTNASWTLKADLVSRYVCRLLNAMRRRGVAQATPHNDDPAMPTQPFADFTSGYVQRAAAGLPRQGSRRPWRLHQNYLLDLMALRAGSLAKGMRFSNPASGTRP
ncbi:MAG: flavin-containing monooxygenase [Janthinobacterium lividum]